MSFPYLYNSIGALQKLNQVYVEVNGSDLTGLIGRSDKPFATINAAISALPAVGGVVNLGIGVFSPVDQLYTLLPAGDYAKDYLIFSGSGMPEFNPGYTGLVGGTIIQGPLVFDRNNVELYNFGVDSGSAVCTSLYSGTGKNALTFGNSLGILTDPKTGIVVQNITAICQSVSTLFHAAIFENLKNPFISNIKTLFGTHGIVIKSSGGTYSNLQAKGHASDALIIKSDDYGQAFGVTITNLTISSFSGQDTRGIIFDTVASSNPYKLNNINITGYVADNVLYPYTMTAGTNINREIANISINGMKLLNGTKNVGSLSGVVDKATITVNNKSLALLKKTVNAKVSPSDGMGSSYDSFSAPAPQATIAGARTSDTVFTRTAGTWIASALVGQFAFSYATATPNTGVWLPIIANTTTTLTVTGVLDATGTSVITSPYNPIAATYAHGEGANAFRGGCFDGVNLWFAPYASANIMKVNPSTGAITAIAHGQAANAYQGAIFDGVNVWLIPHAGANITKINPTTNALTHYAHGQATVAFIGSAFDGINIWMAPWGAANILKFNIATGVITTIAHGQGANAFCGCVFDGHNIWLIPNYSANVLKLNVSTGTFTLYPHSQTAAAFRGGCFDGHETIWLAPFVTDVIARLDITTGLIDTNLGYHGQGATAFMGSIFDGEAIWLIPYSSSNILRINPSDGSFKAYPHGQGATAFCGAIYDNRHIWLVPLGSANIVKIAPPRIGLQA